MSFDPTRSPPSSPLLPKADAPFVADPMPPDIERVWGEGRLDGTGYLAADMARKLIDAWGLDTFRNSAVHKAELSELGRHARVERQKAEYRKRQKSETA